MNKFLILVDCSYWMYHTIFGAIDTFKKEHEAESSYWLKPIEETDQDNLPNLLNCDTFKKVLYNQVMKRCETIDWLAKQNCQDVIDSVDKIDIVFAVDDKTSKSFRKKLYPAYKAQRELIKRQFKMFPIHDYILNVIFKDLKLIEKYRYKFVKVPNAEGDDVIACLLKNYKKDYVECLLIASDKDFLQIDGIKQVDLMGRIPDRKIANENLTASEFLLAKILLGDKSDNISNVFNRVGPKRVIPYIKDRTLLKEALQRDPLAAQQFKLNKQIISFNEIPKDLHDKIVEQINEQIYRNEILNDSTDLSLWMM